MKAAFIKHALEDFYDAMDYVFRDGFGTGSQSAKNVYTEIKGLLFGNTKEKKQRQGAAIDEAGMLRLLSASFRTGGDTVLPCENFSDMIH